MFQFPGFPSICYGFTYGCIGSSLCGFPHSDIRGSLDICSSPRLFAAYHVFLRLPVPRHPPCALSSLTCSPELLRIALRLFIYFTLLPPCFGVLSPGGFAPASWMSFHCFGLLSVFGFQGTIFNINSKEFWLFHQSLKTKIYSILISVFNHWRNQWFLKKNHKVHL